MVLIITAYDIMECWISNKIKIVTALATELRPSITSLKFFSLHEVIKFLSWKVESGVGRGDTDSWELWKVR